MNTCHVLNVKQLAVYLGIGRNKAYELVHSSDFPALKIGKRIVVPKEQLDEWLKTNSKKFN